MNIQMMGSVKEVSAVFQVSILVMEKRSGGRSAATTCGTHSVTHHTRSHRTVPRAI